MIENGKDMVRHKSNQGNQDSSGNQKNVILEQRPDTENRQSKQKT